MNKKKEMNFNLNNFLLALSLSFDSKNNCINYSKRVAYISLNIGKSLNLTPQEMSDLCSYSLVHGIGYFKSNKLTDDFFNFSQEFSNNLPFLLKNDNILLRKKEFTNDNYLKQILHFSILINNQFNFEKFDVKHRAEIITFIKSELNATFSKEIIDSFFTVSQNNSFYLDLENENELLYFIFSNLHDFTTILSFENILSITSQVYKLINEESQLLDIVSKASDFYEFEHKDKLTFLIAASLNNIGKSFISNEIINKNSKLDTFEYEVIKAYPYYTKKVLSNIMGFNDICNWSYRVQERVNGEGYPFGLDGKELSLKDRLLAVLVAYDSLSCKKPYREAYIHEECIEIMLKEDGLDKAIIEDLNIFMKDS